MLMPFTKVRPCRSRRNADSVHYRRGLLGTAWIDWVTAAVYFGLSTQFVEPTVEDVRPHLMLCGSVAVALVFRGRQPLLVVLTVSLLTSTTVFLGLGSEPLVAAGWAVAAYVGSRRPLRSKAVLPLLVLTAGVAGFCVGGTGVYGPNWGQWIVLSFLCVVAGIAFGADSASKREAVEVAAQMREEDVVQTERLRIAREIHDVSSRTLVSIGVQAGVSVMLDDEAPALRATLRNIELLSKEAAREIRVCLTGLRNHAGRLRSAPYFRAKVRSLLTRFDQVGVKCKALIEISVGVEPGVEQAICRVLEEALTNVVKHARGSNVEVRLAVNYSRQLIELVVEDDGPGFPALEHRQRGYGVIGMVERMTAIGGTLDIENVAGGGAKVVATVPLPAERSR